jgi:NAD(P)H-dependent FMN reductase
VKIAVVLGSTRPGRKGEAVAQWVLDRVAGRTDAEFSLLDLADFDLPLLSEATVPGAANREYETPQTRAWSAAIDPFDGYLWVTPEYNHGVPAALKNAFDVLYPEWGQKAAGLIGYGADGGVRAMEQWRLIMVNAHLYAVRAQLALSIMTEWPGGEFTPNERRAGELDTVVGQLVTLAGALAPLRRRD